MGALQLKKATIMVTVAAYALGWGLYFLAYVTAHWGEMDYLGYVVAEGAANGLAWPYLVYAWLRFGTPLI